MGQTNTASADTPKFKQTTSPRRTTSAWRSCCLSKRTALYGNAGRLKNSGAANFVQSGGPAVGALTSFSSTGFEAGLRHHF